MHFFFEGQDEDADSVAYKVSSTSNGCCFYVSGDFGTTPASLTFSWSFDGVNDWVDVDYNGETLTITEPGRYYDYSLSGVYVKATLNDADEDTVITAGISPS